MKAAVVKVTTFAVTSAVYRSIANTGQACFAVDGLYELEDGTTKTTRITSTRKKDLPDSIAGRREQVAKGEIVIDDGREVWRCYIGPPRKAAQP